MSTDRITPLPISDNPHAGDFVKKTLDDLTAMFGLTFEQVSGQVVGRVNRYHDGGVVKLPFDPKAFRMELPVSPEMRALRERSKMFMERTMQEYWRQRERAAAIYLIGYDPQMLLEDRRGR